MSGNLPFIGGLFVLVIVWLFANRQRQWLHVASRQQAMRASILSRMVVRIPLLCWLAMGILALYALTNPERIIQTTDAVLERRVFTLCLDVSGSMGDGTDGTKLLRVKQASAEFVATREGDVMGVVAYSGTGTPGSDKMSRGYARIIMYPTEDVRQVRAAIQATDSQMFGGSTAIGDGIFVSMMSLIRTDAKKIMGDEFDRWLLQASVESLGTDTEDLRYAQQVAQAIGKQKGKFVLLFSDGESNIGMKPEKALWFARRVGIRVHFVAFSTSATMDDPYYYNYGLDGVAFTPPPLFSTVVQSMSDTKRSLVTAVMDTGGLYLESSDVDAIPKLFRVVHRAEKNRFLLRQSERSIDARYPFYVAIAGFLCLWLFVERLWQKIP